MKIISTALMALGLLLLSGCAPSFTVDDLYGIWTEASGVTQFNKNGTYVVAGSVDGLTSLPPHEYGVFRFEGTTLTLITDKESGLCSGTTGSYEVEMVEEGKIEITLIEDPCEHRSRVWRNVFIR